MVLGILVYFPFGVWHLCRAFGGWLQKNVAKTQGMFSIRRVLGEGTFGPFVWTDEFSPLFFVRNPNRWWKHQVFSHQNSAMYIYMIYMYVYYTNFRYVYIYIYTVYIYTYTSNTAFKITIHKVPKPHPTKNPPYDRCVVPFHHWMPLFFVATATAFLPHAKAVPGRTKAAAITTKTHGDER